MFEPVHELAARDRAAKAASATAHHPVHQPSVRTTEGKDVSPDPNDHKHVRRGTSD